MTECIQLLVPGRVASVSDALIDMSGALAGFMVFFVVNRQKNKYFKTLWNHLGLGGFRTVTTIRNRSARCRRKTVKAGCGAPGFPIP
ncbi:MAG: VanZ family protein [Methylothermaceae bacterium]|nr:VanZ family protein [Methylothermaceae bacterium]